MLFDPRQQRWDDHFHWEGTHIVGRSDVGRTTIRVLCMNSDEQLELRMAGERLPPMLDSIDIDDC